MVCMEVRAISQARDLACLSPCIAFPPTPLPHLLPQAGGGIRAPQILAGGWVDFNKLWLWLRGADAAALASSPQPPPAQDRVIHLGA